MTETEMTERQRIIRGHVYQNRWIYHTHPEWIRSMVDVDMFTVVQEVVRLNASAYPHWIARDPALVFAVNRDRDALVRIQVAVASELPRKLHILGAIPDAVLAAFSQTQVDDYIDKVCTCHLAGHNYGSGVIARSEHLLRVLKLHKFRSPSMTFVARTYPALLRHMHEYYSRSLHYIKGALGTSIRLCSSIVPVLEGLLDMDKDTQIKIAVHIMGACTFRCPYSQLLLPFKYSPEHVEESVTMALDALRFGPWMYQYVPDVIKSMELYLSDAPFIDLNKVHWRIGGLLLQDRQPLSAAMARMAVEDIACYYWLVPTEVVRFLDGSCDGEFTRDVIRREASMGVYAPYNSSAFLDLELCCRVLSEGPAAAYARFPPESRADCLVVSSLVFRDIPDYRDAESVFAAVPQATLLGDGIRDTFLQRLQARLCEQEVRDAPAVTVPPHTPQIRRHTIYGEVEIALEVRLPQPCIKLFREMMYGQPLALRLLHEPLFGALVEMQRAAVLKLMRRLGGEYAEIVARIIGYAFGGAYMRRLREAYFADPAWLEVMRVKWGLRSPGEPRDTTYRALVSSGVLHTRMEPGAAYPPLWHAARHIADHGTPC